MSSLVFANPFSGSNSAGNPASLTAPNPPQAGNLMVAAAKVTGGTSVGAGTIPGFTAETPLQIGNVAHYLALLHLAVAAGQSSTITLTDAGSPTTVQFGIAEFAGVTATQDATLVSSNGGATTKTTQNTGAGITTTAANCLLLAVLGLQSANTATSITVDSGFTIITKANQYALAYRFAPPGTYNPTWAWPTASRVTTVVQAYQASSAANAGFIGVT